MSTTKKIKYVFCSLVMSIAVLSLMSSSYAADEPTELPVVVCPKRIHDNRINKTKPAVITWENIRLYLSGKRAADLSVQDTCVNIGKFKTNSKDHLTVTYAIDPKGPNALPNQPHLFNITMMEDVAGAISDTVEIPNTDYKVTFKYGVGTYEGPDGKDVKLIILQDLIINTK